MLNLTENPQMMNLTENLFDFLAVVFFFVMLSETGMGFCILIPETKSQVKKV